jgi:hypothetical protein
MNDGTGLAEALLGLAGFRVLEVTETNDEVIIDVETMATVAGCGGCGQLEHTDEPALSLRCSCWDRTGLFVSYPLPLCSGHRRKIRHTGLEPLPQRSAHRSPRRPGAYPWSWHHRTSESDSLSYPCLE